MWIILSNTSKIVVLIIYFTIFIFIIRKGILFQLIILLLFTIILVFLININLSRWWALIIFLVYISGLLVLFSYFTAFSAKDNIRFDFKLNFLLRVRFILNYNILYKIKNITFIEWVINNYLIYLIMGIILFFILIVACIMCFKIKIPLRWFIE